MSVVTYKIDKQSIHVPVAEDQEYHVGENTILSNEKTDVCYSQSWYDQGYTVEPLLSKIEFEQLQTGISSAVEKIIRNKLGIEISNFDLTRYHTYIENDSDHQQVVSKTRDLFEKDFNFDIKDLFPKLNKIVGFDLTDFNENTNSYTHIIVRINRPNSNDYNPPHKDMYEALDEHNRFEPFVNFWIPICGVTPLSSLPIVPKSHRIPENKIERTRVGGQVASNKYNVRYVKNWGDNKLSRCMVNQQDVLVFSSHLIHGLAVNSEKDLTRVALEFRLFKK